MRIAVIADIHGNADALRAVLAEIDAQPADLILNLGDHFSGPLAADETAEILLARSDILSLRGNHDRWLLEQDPSEMGLSDAAAFARLSADALAWLRALPPTLNVKDDIFACHATPGDDLTYWLEELSDAGRPGMRGYAGIEELAGDCTAPLMLCAHTHLPRAVRLRDGRMIVNPGSVGCPAYTDDAPMPHVMQSGFPEASYAITEQQETWQVCFHRASYDPTRMADMAQTAVREEWADALRTGWIE